MIIAQIDWAGMLNTIMNILTTYGYQILKWMLAPFGIVLP